MSEYNSKYDDNHREPTNRNYTNEEYQQSNNTVYSNQPPLDYYPQQQQINHSYDYPNQNYSGNNVVGNQEFPVVEQHSVSQRYVDTPEVFEASTVQLSSAQMKEAAASFEQHSVNHQYIESPQVFEASTVKLTSSQMKEAANYYEQSPFDQPQQEETQLRAIPVNGADMNKLNTPPQTAQLNSAANLLPDLHQDFPDPLNSARTSQLASPANLSTNDSKKFSISNEVVVERGRRCGCVPIERRARNRCLTITGVVLVILGILLFLFFPRMPVLTVNNITLPKGGTYKMSPIDLTADIITFTFQMDLILNITLYNPNRYHMKIEDIDLNMYIMANASQINAAVPSPAELVLGTHNAAPVRVNKNNLKRPVGTSNYTNLYLPSFQNTTITMTLDISYSPDPKVGLLNDPAFNEILQICVFDTVLSPTDNRTTLINYDAYNRIQILPFFEPVVSGETRINCPFQGQAKIDFLNAIKGDVAKGKGEKPKNGKVGISKVHTNNFNSQISDLSNTNDKSYVISL
ncbi:hypothetical protein BC833DRAFT_588267 [Globomyces pollinis-pini]|nr:hypothetical protein BC833DRAFT_588267 [Globomyces pollinis-pini]